MNINSDTTKNISNSSDVQYTSSTKNEDNDKKDKDCEFDSFLSTNNIVLSSQDANLLYNLVSVYEMPYNTLDTIGLAQSIQSIKSSFNYDTLTIGEDDARFFDDMIKLENLSLQTNSTQQNIITVAADGGIEKTQQVSKTLLNMLDSAQKTNQPIRIDFDNNISVILKVDREGKLTAEFLPSDAVAEQYLRNNISYLRQSFDAQNISYNDIYYRQNKGNNSKNSNNHQQGEDNE